MKIHLVNGDVITATGVNKNDILSQTSDMFHPGNCLRYFAEGKTYVINVTQIVYIEVEE